MKRTRKALLLEQYKNLGFDEEHVQWVKKRYTAEQIQNLIDNYKTHDVIAKIARKQKGI